MQRAVFLKKMLNDYGNYRSSYNCQQSISIDNVFDEFFGLADLVKDESDLKEIRQRVEKMIHKLMSYSEVHLKSKINLTNCYNIVHQKNNDYSQKDNAFSNFLLSRKIGIKPEIGIIIRITDKMSRLQELRTKQQMVADESVVDTISDTINYCEILLLFLESNYES